MQHQMVKRCVGKAEENLVGSRCCLLYCIVCKQIRCQTIRVISPDGTQDHIDLRIPERREQILGTLFRMVLDVFSPCQRMRQIPEPDSHFRKPFFADHSLVAHIRLAERTG